MFIGLYHAFKDLHRVCLQAEGDGTSQFTVVVNDVLGIAEGLGVDVAADKFPAIFAVSNNGVDCICTDTNVQNANRLWCSDSGMFCAC